MLHFIQKNIMHVTIFDFRINVGKESIRIA